jgi:hypothetical protein
MALRDLFVWRTYDPDAYTHSELLQRNEKIKAGSLFCNNAGLALLIAGVARWFDPKHGLDRAAIAAFCVGAVGVTLSVFACTFLKEVEWP